MFVQLKRFQVLPYKYCNVCRVKEKAALRGLECQYRAVMAGKEVLIAELKQSLASLQLNRELQLLQKQVSR